MIPLLTQLRIALRSLLRSVRRSGISMAMIAICYAAVLLQQAFTHRAEKHLTVNSAYGNYAGHISLFRKDGLDRWFEAPSRYVMPTAELDDLRGRLAALDGVEFVGAYLLGAGLVSNGCRSIPFVGLGIDMSVDERVRNHPELARWTCLENPTPLDLYKHVETRPGAIALTPRMAQRLGKPKTLADLPPGLEATTFIDCDAADKSDVIASDADVQLLAQDTSGDMTALDATIVQQRTTGRMFAEDYALRASSKLMEQLLGLEGATYLAVYLKPDVNPADVIAKFKAALAPERRDAYELFPALSEELNPEHLGNVKWLTWIDYFMLGILGVIVSIMTCNFVAMSIVERRREIGILRALGFSPQTVQSLFRLEFLVVTACGLLLGGILARVCVVVVNSARLSYDAPNIEGSALFLLDLSQRHVIVGALAIAAMVAVSTSIVSSVMIARRPLLTLFSNSR